MTVDMSRTSDSDVLLITDFRVVFFWKDVGVMERNGSGFYSEWATTEL